MDFLFIYLFSSPARRGVQKPRVRCNLHGSRPQLALVQFLIGGNFEMLVKRKQREEAAGSLPQTLLHVGGRKMWWRRSGLACWRSPDLVSLPSANKSV